MNANKRKLGNKQLQSRQAEKLVKKQENDVYLYPGNVLFARSTTTASRVRVSGGYIQKERMH